MIGAKSRRRVQPTDCPRLRLLADAWASRGREGGRAAGSAV